MENGIKVVLCSGRSVVSLKPLLEELQLNVPGQYGISLNGAVVFEADTGKPVAISNMKDEDAAKILDIGWPLLEELNIQLYTDKDIYVPRWDETTTFYEQVTKATPKVTDNLKNKAHGVTKMSFFQKSEEMSPTSSLDSVLNLKARVEKSLPENVKASISAPYLLEFMDKSVSKAVGMAKLGEILQISSEEMMAMGDLENDLEMIEYAGIGVAMKNGATSVKEKANYLTECTNNEGGVAEAIEKFCLQGI